MAAAIVAAAAGVVMAVDPQVLLIIAAMALVTYIPRMAPMVVLSGRSLPPVVMEWLGLLPAALLGALVAQAVLMPEGALDLSLKNPALIPTAVAALAAWRFRSLALTVLSGMAAAGLVRWWLGG